MSLLPLLPNLDVTQWGVAAAAALGLGISRYGFPGLYLLVVVGFAHALPGTASLAVIQPLILFGNLMVLRVLLPSVSWTAVQRIVPACLFGIAVGSLVVRFIPSAAVTRLVGTFVLIQVIWHVGRNFLTRWSAPDGNGRAWTWGTGLLTGVATMVANVGTPILTMQLLSIRLERERFAATQAGIFLVLTLVKLPVTCAMGFYGGDEFAFDVLMIPLVAIGLPMGRLLLRVVPANWADGFSIVATSLAAGRLLLAV